MQNLGLLLLRLSIGGMMIFHGIDKILNGNKFVQLKLEEAGLPGFLEYGVYVGEVAAPALVIIGFFTRLSALAIAGTMAMAIYLAHLNDLTSLGAHGEWAVETPMLFLLGALSIAMLGAGSLSVDGKRSSPA